MAANKMAPRAIDANKEDQAFAAEVEAVKKWWSDSRWRYTKRPFTAEQIVAKRGTLKIEYASNAMSKKLWNTLEGRFNVCLCANILPKLELTRYFRKARQAIRTDVLNLPC
jgi:isocitrate lyase